METLILFLGTFIASNYIDKKTKYTIYKQIADEGAKLTVPIFFKDRITFATKLIPFVNILSSMLNYINITQDEECLLLFRTKGIIEDMTDEENKEYQKNPTGKNASKVFNLSWVKYILQELKENQHETTNNSNTSVNNETYKSDEYEEEKSISEEDEEKISEEDEEEFSEEVKPKQRVRKK